MSVSCDTHPKPGQGVHGSAVAAKFEVEIQSVRRPFGHTTDFLAGNDGLVDMHVNRPQAGQHRMIFVAVIDDQDKTDYVERVREDDAAGAGRVDTRCRARADPDPRPRKAGARLAEPGDDGPGRRPGAARICPGAGRGRRHRPEPVGASGRGERGEVRRPQARHRRVSRSRGRGRHRCRPCGRTGGLEPGRGIERRIGGGTRRRQTEGQRAFSRAHRGAIDRSWRRAGRGP